MAETNNEINLADVIKEQSTTIETLVSQFTDISKSGGATQQPIYMTTPVTTEDKPPNYILIIGLVIVAVMFFTKGRLF